MQAVAGEGQQTVTSACTSVWEKAAPPALALKPDNAVPPCMSLALFKLLPQHWSSEQVSLSARNCLHLHLRGSTWDTSKQPSRSLSHNPCQVSQPEVIGIPYLAQDPGLRRFQWGWDPLLLELGVAEAPKAPGMPLPPFLDCHTVSVGSAPSTPPTHLPVSM